MRRDLERPLACLGIVIPNHYEEPGEDETALEGKIFVFRRKESPGAGTIAMPGGAIENGRSVADQTVDEAREETGIEIVELEVIGTVSDRVSYQRDGVQNLAAIVIAHEYRGTPRIMQPHKHEDPMWASPKALPQPVFPPSEGGVLLWLTGAPFLELNLDN